MSSVGNRPAFAPQAPETDLGIRTTKQVYCCVYRASRACRLNYQPLPPSKRMTKKHPEIRREQRP